MTNNDILRRLRYTFDFGDDKMIAIFALADHKVSREQVSNWLKKDDDTDFEECKDIELAQFLNGLIVKNRGEKEGEKPIPEKILTNNLILIKLRIALNLKAEDMLKIMELADYPMSKHELSSYFRKKDNRHYSKCTDQTLRNFFKGLQMKYRPNHISPDSIEQNNGEN